MLRRRRLLASLFAALLPPPLARADAARRKATVRPGNGWVVAERDFAAIARLDR